MSHVARAIADAVLYEGYLLYPYRASASKNQARFQWGVLVPPALQDVAAESSSTTTEVLLEGAGDTRVAVTVRGLQAQMRTGGGLPTWAEGVERETTISARLDELLKARTERLELPAGEEAEQTAEGEVLRRRVPVSVDIVLAAEALPGPYGLHRLHVEVRNATADADAVAATTRDEAVLQALIGAHVLLDAPEGTFLSLYDPPEWATPAAEACRNERTWPVLITAEDGRDVVLSSPIILGDHPQLAPESGGDWYDATEMDELLALRTSTLTDEEKAAARATDPRAAALIDRAEELMGGGVTSLHGARRPGANGDAVPTYGLPDHPEGSVDVPWWDPAADASVDPATDVVLVGDVRVARGTRVRLNPGSRRADAHDMFLVGLSATVEAVVHDVDGETHIAVTLDGDAEATDLARWHGRYLYFHPDEVVPA